MLSKLKSIDLTNTEREMREPELIESIRALTTMLEDNARQAEKDRKPVDAVMTAIEETQAYRWFVPKKYGGFEFSL